MTRPTDGVFFVKMLDLADAVLGSLAVSEAV
jgi:hypothetical protein